MQITSNVSVGEPGISVYVSLGNLFLKKNRHGFPDQIKRQLPRPHRRSLGYHALLNIGLENQTWQRALLSISNPQDQNLDIIFDLPPYHKMVKGLADTKERKLLGETSIDDILELMEKQDIDPPTASLLAFWGAFEKQLVIDFKLQGKRIRIRMSIGTFSFSKNVSAKRFFEAMRVEHYEEEVTL